MNTKEKIEIMQAWLDGKTIQIFDKSHSDWKDLHDEPTWDFMCSKYRIKPKQKVKKTIKYLCFDVNGLLYFTKENSCYHLRFKNDTNYTRVPEFDKTREIEVEE